MKTKAVLLVLMFKLALCRDFYIGMFKRNDFLVAEDTVYKEKRLGGFVTAKYGRTFHCPITYFRVTDRLGMGRPPFVKITRGGLQKKFITVQLTAMYNTPIAVNIYVGCKNDLTTTRKTTTTSTTTKAAAKNDTITDQQETSGGDVATTDAAGGTTTGVDTTTTAAADEANGGA